MPNEPSVFEKYHRLVTLEQKRVRLSSSLSQAEGQLRSTVQALRAAMNKQSSGNEFELQIESHHKRVVDLKQGIDTLDSELTSLEAELPAAAHSSPGSVLARPKSV